MGGGGGGLGAAVEAPGVELPPRRHRQQVPLPACHLPSIRVASGPPAPGQPSESPAHLSRPAQRRRAIRLPVGAAEGQGRRRREAAGNG